MGENIESKTLETLMGDTDIRIPRIQRDYAQGRRLPAVDKIRRDFVQDLVAVAKGETNRLNLDFVYGSYHGTPNSRAFEPLDGQQRLTTLYLLHWLIGADLKKGFTYATRPSSNEFFQFLKGIDSEDIIKAWCADGDKPFSEILSGWENYLWKWKYDPTIQSVLVMLDEMAGALGRQWLSESRSEASHNLSKISFEYLDLEALGLQKSLYVKMNARGKQLSDFDLLKSTLEQDILRQLSEAADEAAKRHLLEVQKKWREKIDTAWVDALGRAYANDAIARTLKEDTLSRNNQKIRSQIAADIETRLHRLLLVYIYRQILLSGHDGLYDSKYKKDVEGLQQNLDAYLQAHRTEAGGRAIFDLDYSRLMEDIDAVLAFIPKDGVEVPVIMSLSGTAFMENSPKSYLDMLTAEERNIDDLAILHAIIVWLDKNPRSNVQLSVWLRDFNDWTRFARNVLSNNNNYNRLDTLSNLIEAMKGVDSMIATRFIPDADGYKSVVERIFELPEAAKGEYSGLDNSSINEEREKAALKMSDPVWVSLIDSAESRPYVWGQIRWLLNWSKSDSGTDKDKFSNYSEKFEQLRAFATGPWKQVGRFRAAMFILNHENFESTDFRTFAFNNDRDNSVKYYLRYKDGIFGNRIKHFIDRWMASGHPDDIGAYCAELIANAGAELPLWVRAISLHPELVYEDVSDYKIFIDQGHTCLLRKKTSAGGYNDPVIRHLEKALRHRYAEGIAQGTHLVQYYNSKCETPNRIELYTIDAAGNRDIHFAVYWGSADNEYLLFTPTTTTPATTPATPHPLSADEILTLSFLDD